MEIRTAYGPKIKSTIECPPGLTEQSSSEECDINNIMAKFIKTGNFDHAKKYEDKYGDTNSASLHEAMNIITSAETMFMELPAKTRERFKNDPADFLDFVQDEKNHQEMYELGLSKTPPVINVAEPPPPPGEPEAPQEPPQTP